MRIFPKYVTTLCLAFAPPISMKRIRKKTTNQRFLKCIFKKTCSSIISPDMSKLNFLVIYVISLIKITSKIYIDKGKIVAKVGKQALVP